MLVKFITRESNGNDDIDLRLEERRFPLIARRHTTHRVGHRSCCIAARFPRDSYSLLLRRAAERSATRCSIAGSAEVVHGVSNQVPNNAICVSATLALTTTWWQSWSVEWGAALALSARCGSLCSGARMKLGFVSVSSVSSRGNTCRRSRRRWDTDLTRVEVMLQIGLVAKSAGRREWSRSGSLDAGSKPIRLLRATPAFDYIFAWKRARTRCERRNQEADCGLSTLSGRRRCSARRAMGTRCVSH